MGLTGLEPVTLRLSSACSNQLSYRPYAAASPPIFDFRFGTTGAQARIFKNFKSAIGNLKSNLEARGFEPLTSSLQSWRSTN
jgi:hypothetical protein